MNTTILRFIPITQDYIDNPEHVIQKLKIQEGAYLCGRESFGSLKGKRMLDVRASRMKNKDIIVLNEYVNPSRLSNRVQLREFQFCSYCSSSACTGIIENRHALVLGNYFLCRNITSIEDATADEIPGGQALSISFTHEYVCHTDLNNCRYHTKYPAYVNLDRSSDNIGMSSWDGNLTSWMRAGFTTRIQYGVQAGLFPEE
jgi:hypothetical protein